MLASNRKKGERNVGQCNIGSHSRHSAHNTIFYDIPKSDLKGFLYLAQKLFEERQEKKQNLSHLNFESSYKTTVQGLQFRESSCASFEIVKRLFFRINE